jgi:hypothetical protein
MRPVGEPVSAQKVYCGGRGYGSWCSVELANFVYSESLHVAAGTSEVGAITVVTIMACIRFLMGRNEFKPSDIWMIKCVMQRISMN